MKCRAMVPSITAASTARTALRMLRFLTRRPGPDDAKLIDQIEHQTRINSVCHGNERQGTCQSLDLMESGVNVRWSKRPSRSPTVREGCGIPGATRRSVSPSLQSGFCLELLVECEPWRHRFTPLTF